MVQKQCKFIGFTLYLKAELDVDQRLSGHMCLDLDQDLDQDITKLLQ